MGIRVGRVWEERGAEDGVRVLVDRLWPRGLTKERAAIDLWAKDVAPSTALRRAYHRDGLPWEDFERAYRAELADNPALAALRDELARHPVSTLLYAAHDPARNHAVILLDVLEG